MKFEEHTVRVEAVESPTGYIRVSIILHYPERPATAYVRRDTAIALAVAIIRATNASGLDLANAVERASREGK